MIKDVVIEISLINQRRDTHNKEWAHRTCAICCLKMVLVFKNKKYAEITIMELVKEGLSIEGYIEKVGWKHEALVKLAKKYGVEMKFQKIFFYGLGKKLKGLRLVNNNILKQQPVIVSVFNKNGNGGHMLVVNGLRRDGRAIVGYFVLDPNSKKKSGQFVSKNTFINNWRGGLILLNG